MTDQLDPTPLFQDLAIDSSLRQDLEAAQGSTVTYDAELGAAAFEAQLAAATAASSVSGLKVLGWFVGAVILLGGGALAGQAWLGSQPGQPDSAITASLPSGPGDDSVALVGHPRSLSFDPSWAAPLETVETVETVDTVDTIDTVELAEADGADGPGKSRPKATHTKQRTSGDFAKEAEQLQKTRRALTHNPNRALALAEEGHTEFPNGALRQEREGLAILALVEMERVEQAQRRADRFLAKHPHGPVSARVRRALDSP